MIRPLTIICFLLACGSGLYLYQTKHRVQMLDRQIEETVHATDVLREQTRVLHAEWTLQNDPQRLQALADQFLTLKTVQPGQFTSMADLDGRLPAVAAPVPTPPPAPEQAPIAKAPDVVAQQPEQPVPPPEPPTVAAPPKPVVVAVAPPRVPEHRVQPSPPPRSVVAEGPRMRPPPAAAHPLVAAAMARPMVPAPYAGSALGMARNASMAVPLPTPVSASQWVNNGGGGG